MLGEDYILISYLVILFTHEFVPQSSELPRQAFSTNATLRMQKSIHFQIPAMLVFAASLVAKKPLSPIKRETIRPHKNVDLFKDNLN